MLSFRRYISELFDTVYPTQMFMLGSGAFSWQFMLAKIAGKIVSVPAKRDELSAYLNDLVSQGTIKDPMKEVEFYRYSVDFNDTQYDPRAWAELSLMSNVSLTSGDVFELSFSMRPATLHRVGKKYQLEWDAGSDDDLNIFDATTASKILSTVTDVCKNFKSKVNPMGVLFGTKSTANPARGKIYKAIAKRVGGQLGGIVYDLGTINRPSMMGRNTLANTTMVWFDKNSPAFNESTQPIVELFDKPYSIRVKERSPANFPNGNYITYTANTNSGLLEIEVANVGPTAPWEITFQVNGSTDITNANEPFKILATVLEAIRDFLKRYTDEAGELPSEFSFIAKETEPKREKVYMQMIQKFGSKYGYKLSKRDPGLGLAQLVFRRN